MSLFFLFLMIKLLPRSTPFPYTTLFRSVGFVGGFAHEGVAGVPGCSGVAMASHRIRRTDIQCSEGSRNMRRSLATNGDGCQEDLAWAQGSDSPQSGMSKLPLDLVASGVSRI